MAPKWAVKLAALVAVPVMALCLLCVSGRVYAAGPPFLTDDPEPTDYLHWEVYLASQHTRDVDDWEGTAPHLDINYGAAPNTQLSVVVPLAFIKARGQALQYGLGDIQVGVKYRFLQETRSRPQIGTFPQLELPTGDSRRGLGNGIAQFFLPLWIQKSWGAWTTYGGGGYWHNPGAGNRDFWYAGWLLQRDVSERLTLGGELFHTTASTVDGHDTTGLNLGLIYHFNEGHHLLLSAGSAVKGPGRGLLYVGYLWLFGPHPAGEKRVQGR